MTYQRYTPPSRFIYVVETIEGHLKVGCSRTPRSREHTIRLHSPILCRLIAIWPGNQQDETAIHKQLGASRSHSEWFKPSDLTRAFAASVRGKGVEIAPWEDCTFEAAVARARKNMGAGGARMKELWADPVWRARQMQRRFPRAKRKEAA